MQMATPQVTRSNQDLVQETLLGEALEHAPVGAIVLDENGTYLAANRLACELSGYSREELLEGGARALAFDPEKVPRTMRRMVNGELRDGVGRMRHKDGTTVTCEFRVGETRSGGLPFYVVVFWERDDGDIE
jgi:PAS domain S-box-containing protein